MLEIQKKTLDESLKKLNLLSAVVQYAVITDDGQKFGTLDTPVPVTKPKRKFLHPRGSYMDYFMPYIKDMKPSDVVQIPPMDGRSLRELRAAVMGYCSHNWGNGSATSTVTDTHVELMRQE